LNNPGGAWPLFDRFPRLAGLPRVDLRAGPTPVESLESVAGGLWIKRDDLTALPIGGNKVRALEFLLGDLRPGQTVTTVGPRGSTHALSTAVHGRALGASVSVGLWPQEMNPVAEVVAAELARVASHRRRCASAATALPWLWWRDVRGDRVIPPGGTSPLGILGHVNAALELARQVGDGLLPTPERVVGPHRSGGPAAGRALGFAIAGMRTTVIGARVVPRIVGRKRRVLRLARATHALMERVTGRAIDVGDLSLLVADDVYGDCYGRPLGRGAAAASRLAAAANCPLDATYSEKALVAALEASRGGPTVFWLTFDGRWMADR
jgi:D-cysteine desulfhydrase